MNGLRLVCLLFGMTLSWAFQASASLGESAKEAAARYGAGKTVDPGKPAEEAETYSFLDMTVLVEFWHGRSSGEQYRKANAVAFSEAETAALLQANAGGSSWHPVGADTWVRVDLKAVAFTGDKRRALAVQTYAFHVETQKNRAPAATPPPRKAVLDGPPPATLTRIVVRYLSPDLAPDAFAAKPKTFYLAGDTYARVEEEPDPAQHLHGLIISGEPDIWMINLDDKTGRHMVDPGPTFVTHYPLVDQGAPGDLASLDMGREVEWFRRHQVTRLDPATIEGQRCEASECRQANYRLVLNVREDNRQPFQLDVFKDAKPEFSVRYVSYETGLPFDAALFTPPADVAITEGKPDHQ